MLFRSASSGEVLRFPILAIDPDLTLSPTKTKERTQNKSKPIRFTRERCLQKEAPIIPAMANARKVLEVEEARRAG